MEELTVADTKASTIQIVSPASPPSRPEEQFGPCSAGLKCLGHDNCPCPELDAQVSQIVSPSSPVDLPGVQARPCMAGLDCRGNCPCPKRVTFSFPPHRIVPPKYKPDHIFCDGLCEGNSKPCQWPPILKQSGQHISVAKRPETDAVTNPDLRTLQLTNNYTDDRQDARCTDIQDDLDRRERFLIQTINDFWLWQRLTAYQLSHLFLNIHWNLPRPKGHYCLYGR